MNELPDDLRDPNNAALGEITALDAAYRAADRQLRELLHGWQQRGARGGLEERYYGEVGDVMLRLDYAWVEATQQWSQCDLRDSDPTVVRAVGQLAHRFWYGASIEALATGDARVRRDSEWAGD